MRGLAHGGGEGLSAPQFRKSSFTMSVNNANGLARSQRDQPRPTTARPAKAEEGETEGETPDLNDPLLLQRRPHSQHYYPHLAVPEIHGHCKPKLASGITHVQFHIELHLSFGSIAPISRCTSLDRRVALSDGAASGRLLGARPNCPHSLSLSMDSPPCFSLRMLRNCGEEVKNDGERRKRPMRKGRKEGRKEGRDGLPSLIPPPAICRQR